MSARHLLLGIKKCCCVATKVFTDIVFALQTRLQCSVWKVPFLGCLLSRVHLCTSHTGLTLLVCTAALLRLWRKRSSRVEGHETGASGETISLLTPCASRRPRLHHRSAVGSRPQCPLSVYNQSNYSSLLATEAEREEQMHFILSGTSGARAGGGQKSQGFQNKMTQSEVQIPSYSHSFGCLSGSCRTQFRTQIQ